MGDSDAWCCDGHCDSRFKPTDMIDIIMSQGVDIPSLCDLQSTVDILVQLVDELTSEEDQWPDIHLHRQLCSCVAHCLRIPGMEKPVEVPAEGLDVIFCLLETLQMSTQPVDQEKAPVPELLCKYDSEIMEALGYAAANFTAALQQLYKPQKGKENKKMKLQNSSEYPNGNPLEVSLQLMFVYDRLCKIYPDDKLTESAAAVEDTIEALEDAIDAATEAHMQENL